MHFLFRQKQNYLILIHTDKVKETSGNITTYPKISVVTPSYNQAAYLEETILSVLNQNYPNLEYIIIDGGSTDNSIEIIKKYKDQLTYWVSEPDKGMYYALQKGFEKTSGEVMTWINSDDTLSKKSLFTVAEVFRDYPDLKWLSGVPNQIDEMGRIIAVGGIQSWNKYRYHQNDYKFIQQEGTFWKRNLWNEAGGFISTEYKLASDLELWSRFLQFSSPSYITGMLGSFRMRSNDQKSLEGFDAYLKEAEHVIGKLPQMEEVERNLKLKRSRLWQLLQRKPLRIFFKIMGYHKIEQIINEYPPILKYDREKQKFIIR